MDPMSFSAVGKKEDQFPFDNQKICSGGLGTFMNKSFVQWRLWLREKLNEMELNEMKWKKKWLDSTHCY